MTRALLVLLTAVAAGVSACGPVATSEPALPPGAQLIGLATVDITPDEPIRLAGYAGREDPVSEVLQPLRAKAIAFGGDAEGPSVLVALDLIGVPGQVTEEVARRLEAVGVERDQFVLTATHTHSGPELAGVLPTHIVKPRTAEDEAVIHRYTERLVSLVEQAALAALADRRPAHLAWSQGRAGFAANRRVLEKGKWAAWGIQPDGTVDHDLPVMRVTDMDGGLRAVILSYACHATTFGGDAIHGDWPGAARDTIEARHPGTMAMVLIGAGADANPNPRKTAEAVVLHARTVADEVDRLLAAPMRPIADLPDGHFREITLDFDSVPSRTELESVVGQGGRPGITADFLLSRLSAGEDIGHSPYPVQTWTFGDSLAMVFLAGEVVADYGLRLKRELGPSRVWVNAYSNSAPFYVASERMIAEGGYEVDESMLSYGHPSRLANGTEQRIIDAVHELLPASFAAGVDVRAAATSRGYLDQEPDWYGGSEAIRLADNLLAYQQESGGWPSLTSRIPVLLADYAVSPGEKQRTDAWIIATQRKLRFIARVREATGLSRFDTPMLSGIDYLVNAQYPNGGLPKFFPDTAYRDSRDSAHNPRGRAPQITLNDGSMPLAMQVLLDVAQEAPEFAFVDAERRQRVKTAVAKGAQAFVETQIEVDGRLTGWAQYHDEVTLEPRWGRKFEPKSIAARETLDVLRFLTRIEEPGPEVIGAVQGAVAWLDGAKLSGLRDVEDPRPMTVPNWDGTVTFTGRHDHTIEQDPDAPPLWAHFYEIGTNRPVFASDDDTVRYSLTEITPERRSGYQWYGQWPSAWLANEYPAWLRKHGLDSVLEQHAGDGAPQ